MFKVEPEKLINAIKPRPALYNKDDELYYTHKKNKDKIWREVCAEVNANWNQMSQRHKAEFVREVQKRWKSLRTCFSRELAYQKKEKIKLKSGQHVKRRKIYEYFTNMLFLLDATDDNDVERDSDDSTDTLDNSSYQPEELISDYGKSSNEVKNVPNMKVEVENTATSHYPQAQLVYERNSTIKEKVIDMLNDLKRDENDEDRQFMLSLVPNLRQLNAKQKLAARIKILKVLQRILDQEN